MDKAKKKQIEDRLKELIKESQQADNGNNGEKSDSMPCAESYGNVQVIRRRKGQSERKTVKN